MKRNVSFTIPGPPKAWQRARINPKAKSLQEALFTATGDRAFKRTVRMLFTRECIMKKISWPFTGPIKLMLFFIWPWTKVDKKKPLAEREEFFTGRPDIDNLEKLILDALNPKGAFLGAWADDSQVARVIKAKIRGPEACTMISIDEMEDDD